MIEKLKYKKWMIFSYNKIMLVLFAILATSSLTIPSFAQESINEITITIDKDSYEFDEQISVSGTVKEKLEGYDVILRVFSVTGNLVTVRQLPVLDDNTFGVDLVSGGPLWHSIGTYTIKASYVTTKTAETTFEYLGQVIEDCFAACYKKFQIEGEYVLIPYINGGKVIHIKTDKQANSLIIDMETTRDGTISVILPRSVIDSRLGPDGRSGEDDRFFVLVDGAEVEFEQMTDLEDRVVTIPFSDGTTQIEIIGTWVIPEFGTIAIIVLAVAIVSIVAISTSRHSVLWMKKGY